jgi:hypothetical protein
MMDGDVLVIKGGITSEVLEQVKARVLTSKRSEILYMVVDTYGGSAEAGYRIMRLLTHQYKDIYFIVPDKAMSAGTLMALGSNKIYMYFSSSLGPLDLQREHPSDGSFVSTIDIRDTWTTLSSIASAISRRAFNESLRNGLKTIEAAQLSYDYAAKFIQPITSKIDPYHLHSSYRSSTVSANYATTLLTSRMMKGLPNRAGALSRKLAEDYDTHSYAITLDEARTLGLVVEDITTLPRWDEIEAIYITSGDGVQLGYIKAKALSNKQKITAKKGKTK